MISAAYHFACYNGVLPFSDYKKHCSKTTESIRLASLKAFPNTFGEVPKDEIRVRDFFVVTLLCGKIEDCDLSLALDDHNCMIPSIRPSCTEISKESINTSTVDRQKKESVFAMCDQQEGSRRTQAHLQKLHLSRTIGMNRVETLIVDGAQSAGEVLVSLQSKGECFTENSCSFS